LGNQQLRCASFPGHRGKAFSASGPHAQSCHAARAGGGLGHPSRLACDLRIRRPTVDRAREPDHKTRHCARAGQRRPRVFEWLAIQGLLRADWATGACGGLIPALHRTEVKPRRRRVRLGAMLSSPTSQLSWWERSSPGYDAQAQARRSRPSRRVSSQEHSSRSGS